MKITEIRKLSSVDDGEQTKARPRTRPRRASLVLLAVACACIAMAGLSAMLFMTTTAAQTPDVHQDKPHTYYIVDFTNPAPGKEDEYNWWYDAHHAPDVVANPGFVSSQRFVASDKQLQDIETPRKYLTIYTIVTDDLAAVHEENSRRLRTGIIPVSPALDLPSTIFYTYKAMEPVIEHEGHDAPTGELQTYCLLVFSSADPEKAEEYNKWFGDAHALRDIVVKPGFLTGQRLALLGVNASPTSGPYAGPHPLYPRLALFRMATNDLTSAFDAFNRHAPPSGSSLIYVFKTHGPLIDGDKIRAQCAGITVSPCP
jgi:hypothetical protein